MPSFILIHPTVWPQYTNVTSRHTGQTDRQTGQRSDSIGRTVLHASPKTYKPIDMPLRGLTLAWLKEQGIGRVGTLAPPGKYD